MFETPDGHPKDFESFRASRSRFLDNLAAESLLIQIERAARRDGSSPREGNVDPPIVIEGELAILTAEHRLVLDYFSPSQRDLADVVRESLGFRDEAFGVGQVGRVRVTVERLPEPVRRPAAETGR